MKPPAGLPLVTSPEFRAAAVAGKVLPLRKEYAGGVLKEEGAESLSFVLSTATADRENDVVAQAGWRLEAYQRNPVMLWAHDYRQLPVGKPSMVGVDGDKLVARGVTFPGRDSYAFGWTVGEMYRQGFLHAVSVGFRPAKWNFNADRGGMDFLEQELLEFSAVPVPANPEALIGAKSAGIPLEPLLEWMEQTLDESADPEKRAKLLVPREYVERCRRMVAPSAFSVARASEEDDEGEDVLVAKLDALTAAVERLTDTLTKAMAAGAHPPPSLRSASVEVAQVARLTAEEVLRQLTTE